MLSFFPRDVLDEILDLIESVSEGFPSYSKEKIKDDFGRIPSIGPTVIGLEKMG